MICHTHATGGNRTTRDTDDDDDDEEEDDEEEDDTRLHHATSTLCARMRPARLLPDCPFTHQQHQKQQQQQQQQRLRQRKKPISRQTSTGAQSKNVYRLPLSLSRVKKATPKSSTTTTEEVSRPDWRDLRVQRTASAESTVQPSRRRRRRRRNPGVLAFPRRCGAVVRSTGVG